MEVLNNKQVDRITPNRLLDQYLPFNLHEQESLVTTIKPSRAKFMAKKLIVFYIVMFILLIPLVYPGIFPHSMLIMNQSVNLNFVIAIAILILSAGALLVVWLMYSRLAFWVTDRRIVNRSGIIGYTIDSIPIDVITDVIIYRNIFDMILNGSNIHITTIDDTIYTLYKRWSGINHIPMLEPYNAMEMQKLIFQIRDQRRTNREFVNKTLVTI